LEQQTLIGVVWMQHWRCLNDHQVIMMAMGISTVKNQSQIGYGHAQHPDAAISFLEYWVSR
jgi:hypothetical protein